jgi:hypothetical protein
MASSEVRPPLNATSDAASAANETTTSNTLPAGFKEYEDGKHRRYDLLFKVNGAAFVIAGLFTKGDTHDIIQGVFSLQMLGIGMALFTLLMGIDIFAFGWNMKQVEPHTALSQGLFRPIGMVVLTCIVVLIMFGWALVAYYGPTLPAPPVKAG